MKRYQKNEIAKAVFAVSAAAGVVAGLAVFPGMAVLYHYIDAHDRAERRRVYQAVQRMKRRELLVRKVINGREELVISKKGQQALGDSELDALSITRQNRWDGRWRVVMFDIPEEKRAARNALTAHLKGIGMYPIQRSAFVTPFPCVSAVRALADHYDVMKHLFMIEADNIETTIDLVKYFKLPRRRM